MKNQKLIDLATCIMQFFQDNEKKLIKLAGSVQFWILLFAKYVMGYSCARPNILLVMVQLFCIVFGSLKNHEITRNQVIG